MNRWQTILFGVAVVMLGSGCVIIEDGEVGVLKAFGSISDDPVLQGVSLVIPVARQIETWNIKLQEVKETAQVPSSEGLIVGLDAFDHMHGERQASDPGLPVPLVLQIELGRCGVVDLSFGTEVVDRLDEKVRLAAAH